jgi:cytoskeletal protein CcmA (bactofilin family)
MSRTDREEVRITGQESHDSVDAWRFSVNGTGSVGENLVAEEVTVNGTLSVGGSLEAEDVDVDGGLTVDGDAAASSLEVDGSGSFGRAVSADYVEATGSLSVEGNLDAHDVEGEGATSLAGSVVANEAEFAGTVSVEGVVDVRELEVDGAGSFADVSAAVVEVDGSLSAGEVTTDWFELDVTAHSPVDRVAATEVHVEREGGIAGFLRRLVRRGDPVLEVDTVVGEAVDLDATRAGTVVGDEVRLGENAEVDVVYTDELWDAPGATVGDVRPRAEYGGGDATGAAKAEAEDVDDATETESGDSTADE